MDVDQLLREYFSGDLTSTTISVFDEGSIYAEYERIVRLLNSKPDIEVTVLQALSYCFYEVLDNVLTHSGKSCGTIVTRYDSARAVIQVLVADDGMGICTSLRQNERYDQITEEEALLRCIEDSVTDGKGMGFGLYSTARLIDSAGLLFSVHSGSHILSIHDGRKTVDETTEWRGTVVYMELHSDIDIDPLDVVDNRTDCVSEFNETFAGEDELDNLW